MKELSIEEKAQRYDKALEKARQLCAYPTSKPFISDLQDLFTELKESEDDRIKEICLYAIKNYLNEHYKDWDNIKGFPKNDVISWLEKQSTPQVRTGLEWVNTIDDACDKRYLEEYAHGEYCHEQSFKWGFQEGVDWLEKQGEKTFEKIVEKARTEKQRVLLTETDGNANIDWDTRSLEDTKILLEYGLDFINKKLEAQGEQKPVWSEEDEKMIQDIINDIAIAQEQVCCKSRCEDEINWLKSLKQTTTWKPSDEQIEALLKLEEMHVLEHERNQENAHLYMVVKSIREQLLKLREE